MSRLANSVAGTKENAEKWKTQFKFQGMQVAATHTIFTGLFMSKIIFALPVFVGQLTADDKNRINKFNIFSAISRKACSWHGTRSSRR